MARDVSGNHTLPAGNPISFGEKPASSSKYNAALSDISTELTDSLSRSGKGAMLAALDMGGFAISNPGAIAGYAPIASPTFTGTVTAPTFRSSGATASRVAYFDANKDLLSSAVTSTELGYLSGVTSAIQTQLNAKAPTASPTFTGTVSAAAITASGLIKGNGGGSGLGAITISTSAPSGGSSGDLWFRY